MRLNGAMIYVKDLARMAEFYELALGLTPVGASRSDVFVEFESAGYRFALHAIPAQLASQIDISSPPEPREANPVKLIFEVRDLAAEAARLESLGVTIIQRPWGTFDGMDPEGNIFGIISSKMAAF